MWGWVCVSPGVLSMGGFCMRVISRFVFLHVPTSLGDGVSVYVLVSVTLEPALPSAFRA